MWSFRFLIQVVLRSYHGNIFADVQIQKKYVIATLQAPFAETKNSFLHTFCYNSSFVNLLSLDSPPGCWDLQDDLVVLANDSVAARILGVSGHSMAARLGLMGDSGGNCKVSPSHSQIAPGQS